MQHRIKMIIPARSKQGASQVPLFERGMSSLSYTSPESRRQSGGHGPTLKDHQMQHRIKMIIPARSKQGASQVPLSKRGI